MSWSVGVAALGEHRARQHLPGEPVRALGDVDRRRRAVAAVLALYTAQNTRRLGIHCTSMCQGERPGCSSATRRRRSPR